MAIRDVVVLRMPSSVRIVKLLVPWEDDMDDVAGAIFVHRAANEQVNP